MNTKQSEHQMRTIEARIKEEQEAKDRLKKAKANLARREREAAYRSLGLKKVKGAMGGTYWE